MNIYLIGSLRNPMVVQVADILRHEGYSVFDDWFAAGPEADDMWKLYEQARGHSYAEALHGLAANHVFDFDKHHLDQTDCVVLLMPAGKSGFLELGYSLGRGKPGFILLDNPDRWDVMLKFATGVAANMEELKAMLARKSDILQQKEIYDFALTDLPSGTLGAEGRSESSSGYFNQKRVRRDVSMVGLSDQ